MLSQTSGHSAARRVKSTKNHNDPIGNRTRELLACRAAPICIHNVKNKIVRINNGSSEDKNVNSVDKVLLAYSSIKFIHMPPTVLHIVMCTEISCIEVFNPKNHVLKNGCFKSKGNKITLILS
jgi:hypothetical protein